MDGVMEGGGSDGESGGRQWWGVMEGGGARRGEGVV